MSKVFDDIARGNPADSDAAERENASIARGIPTIIHRNNGWYVEASDGTGSHLLADVRGCRS